MNEKIEKQINTFMLENQNLLGKSIDSLYKYYTRYCNNKGEQPTCLYHFSRGLKSVGYEQVIMMIKSGYSAILSKYNENEILVTYSR